MMMALAMKRVDPQSSTDANAKITHVPVSVPFKGLHKTRPTVLKVVVPCVELTCDVKKDDSIVLAIPKRAPKKRAVPNLNMGAAHASPGRKMRVDASTSSTAP